VGIFRRRTSTYDGSDAEFHGDGWTVVAEHADGIWAELNDPDSEMAKAITKRQEALDLVLEQEFIPSALEQGATPEAFFRGLMPEYGLDMAIVGRRRLRARMIRSAHGSEFEARCREVESWPENRADRADLMLVIEAERARRGGPEEPADPLRAEVAERTRAALERFELVLMNVEKAANRRR
jgi:hypothetical protein